MVENAANRIEEKRTVKHASVALNPHQAALVHAALSRLNDLTAFVAASAGHERARFIGMQGDRAIFEVPDAG